MLAYKILVNGKGPYSHHKWTTEWMPDVGEPIHCVSGYYGIAKENIAEWAREICFEMDSDPSEDALKFLELWVVELEGVVDFGDKVAGSTARLVHSLGTMDTMMRESKGVYALQCKCTPTCGLYTTTFDSCDHVYFGDKVEKCGYLHFDVPEIESWMLEKH
jgi:hypothetical protein